MKAKEMRCSLLMFCVVKPFAKECFGCQNGIQELFQKENRKKCDRSRKRNLRSKEASMRFHILRIFAFADDCCLKQGTVWKKKLAVTCGPSKSKK